MYTKCTDLFLQSHVYTSRQICFSNFPSFYSVAIDIGQINIFYFLVIEQECKSNRPNAKITENKV